MATSTYNQLRDEAVNQAAVFLKKNWGDINTLVVATAQEKGQSYTPPSQPDFKVMAQELIDQGKIQGLTVQELDAQLDKKDREKRLKKSFGVESLEELIPTAKDLEGVANSVDKRNPENQKTTGFWEGVSSFFANIGKYIVGFFNWVANGFEGGFEGLGKHIKAQFVSGMADEVRADIQAMDSKFLKGRGGANAEMIAQSVKQKGEETIGVRKKADEIPLDSVEQGAVGAATREAIRAQIEKETKELALKQFDETVKNKTNIVTRWWAGKDIKSARTKIADTIAGVVSDVITKKENDNKTISEKIDIIQQQLGSQLKGLGISYLDDETIKNITKETSDALRKNQDITQLEAIFTGGRLAANSVPAMDQSVADFKQGKFKGEEIPMVPGKPQQQPGIVLG